MQFIYIWPIKKNVYILVWQFKNIKFAIFFNMVTRVTKKKDIMDGSKTNMKTINFVIASSTQHL